MAVWVLLQILCFVFNKKKKKKMNVNLDATLDFLICQQKENDSFGVTLKVSYFIVKERMVQF